MGGGLLPVTIHEGKVLFLLGREHDEKKWSDFGGGREGRESHFDTALREGCEELNGFFGCKTHLKNTVKRNYSYCNSRMFMPWLCCDNGSSGFFARIWMLHARLERKLPVQDYPLTKF